MRVRPRCTVQPGDVMLHPVVIVSIAVLALNDHVLKQRWPGALTGVLSDVAGLVFFPLLLVAVAELLGRRVAPPWLLAMCIGLSALVFVSAELVPGVEHVLEGVWGRALGRSLVTFTADPTDLFALPALGASWLVGRGRIVDALGSK